MNRLLDHLLHGNYRAPDYDPVKFRSSMSATLPRAIAVDVQNVFEWCKQQYREDLDADTLLPLCPKRLPFPFMWLEYTGTLPEHPEHRPPRPPEWEPDEHDISTCGHTNVMGVLLTEDEQRGEIICVHFCRHGMGITEMLGAFILEPGEGEAVCELTFLLTDHEHDKPRDVTWDAAFIAINTLIFFSCKNTSLRQHESRSKKSSKAAIRKYGHALPNYHVIEIHHFAGHGKPHSQQQVERSLAQTHIVRGHFKHYTENAPLLGKSVGTYFWHAHVRGQGPFETPPAYRVWAPSKTHSKECVVQEKK